MSSTVIIKTSIGTEVFRAIGNKVVVVGRSIIDKATTFEVKQAISLLKNIDLDTHLFHIIQDDMVMSLVKRHVPLQQQKIKSKPAVTKETANTVKKVMAQFHGKLH
jgi:hypothetical protein